MICIDASLAAKWLLSEPDSPRARAFYRVCVLGNEQFVAPYLLASEITNILRQRMRSGQPRLSLADATELLKQFLGLPVEFLAPADLYEQALILATNHNLPAAYDAQYVALAQLLGCDFWTADQRL